MFTCTGALRLDNTGNVPLTVGGLEAVRATQADGSPCNATSLAPVTGMTCSFVWTASKADAEAGASTINLAADAQEAGAAESNSTAYTASATLPVPQHPAMSVAFEEVTSGPHSSNDSTVTLRGTVLNQGNVKLQAVRMKPTPDINTTPTCTVGAVGDTTATWVEGEDVPVGEQVVYTVTYAIGQDALETTAVSDSGAPQVRVHLSANATATQEQLLLTGSAFTVISVTQTASLAVEILSAQCQVPEEPGTLRFCCALPSGTH